MAHFTAIWIWKTLLQQATFGLMRYLECGAHGTVAGQRLLAFAAAAAAAKRACRSPVCLLTPAALRWPLGQHQHTHVHKCYHFITVFSHICSYSLVFFSTNNGQTCSRCSPILCYLLAKAQTGKPLVVKEGICYNILHHRCFHQATCLFSTPCEPKLHSFTLWLSDLKPNSMSCEFY